MGPAVMGPSGNAPRRRTSQTVPAISNTETARSQPPSVSWNCQNREAGCTDSHIV